MRLLAIGLSILAFIMLFVKGFGSNSKMSMARAEGGPGVEVPPECRERPPTTFTTTLPIRGVTSTTTDKACTEQRVTRVKTETRIKTDTKLHCPPSVIASVTPRGGPTIRACVPPPGTVAKTTTIVFTETVYQYRWLPPSPPKQ